ncbi:Ankyrin repeat [Geosmithia morbida]|uniref:Ankyrin repeat n=1 Tax=Geosmithia morbida TaxID=1094350 RepID=A0A9P4YN34_9HYPO|nr:Ankyrin repeat [Geosmithia morbida]KAF4119991.1 Ankyrin repeat [Geosmithia morbida]
MAAILFLLKAREGALEPGVASTVSSLHDDDPCRDPLSVFILPRSSWDEVVATAHLLCTSFNPRPVKIVCVEAGIDVVCDRTKPPHGADPEAGDVEETASTGLPTPPVPPPSDFISYLSKNPDAQVRELIKPYLEYELELRRAFSQGGTGIDGLANLVQVFDGREDQFLPRASGRNGSDKDKFLMRLPRDKQAKVIMDDFTQYERNFSAFTHSCLAGLDWSNIVAAGSSALSPLLAYAGDYPDSLEEPAVEDPLETYYQYTACSSDIDLFIYGLDEEAAMKKIVEIEATVRENQRLPPGSGITLRTQNALTFIGPRWPYRHVQIVLRLYKSISEVLTGFDVDCACVAFDGRKVYTNPRGVAAIQTQTNLIDLTRRSPSYENRLYKYRMRGFDAYWGRLDRSRIDESSDTYQEGWSSKGLSRLLFFERLLYTHQGSYAHFNRLRHRFKNTDDVAESGNAKGHAESDESGYTAIKLPYGQRYTATTVRKYVSERSREQHVFGTIVDVIEGKADLNKKTAEHLQCRLKFIKDDPGRQMIGSFYPLTEDGWTNDAYVK